MNQNSTPRDQNNVPALAGESTVDNTKTVTVAVNPSTGGVIVQLI